MAGATVAQSVAGVMSDAWGHLFVAQSVVGVLSDAWGQLFVAQSVVGVLSDTKFSVIATYGDGGSISPPGETRYDYLADPSFTIIASDDYIIQDVLVDGVSVGAVSSYQFMNINATHTIHATFELNVFDVVSSTGSNGTISPLGTAQYIYLDDPEYTITPNAHYHILDVLVDSVSVGAVSSYTFTNISANHTISCTFAIDTFTVTASAGSNGSISPTGVSTYNYGTNNTYTITPSAHYHVADVLVDGVSVGAVTSYEFTSISTNHTISCTFAIDTFAITSSSGSHGSISPSGLNSYNYGSNQTYTITPDAHYHVLDVLVDSVSVGAVTSYEFTSISTTHTISCTFSIDQYTVVSSAGSHGSITPSGSNIYDYGTDHSYTITPDEEYYVTDVLMDSVSVGAVTSYLFEDISANHTISCTFGLNEYTITSTSGVHGTISPIGTVDVSSGDTVAFTITPSVGYVPSVLVDGVSQGNISSYTFSNITSNHTIACTFSLASYTIVASSGGNGSISSSGSSSVLYGGSKTYTMTPSDGYHVASILVDGVEVDLATSYAFTEVTDDHTISCTFEEDTFTLYPSTHWTIDIQSYGEVAIYPPPESPNETTDVLDVTYVAIPNEMEEDSDYPDDMIPAQYHLGLAYEAASRLLDEGDDVDVQQAVAFESEANEIVLRAVSDSYRRLTPYYGVRPL